jgi:hypothetical protein
MLSLALNVRRDYQLDLSYLKTGGGDYNLLRDRSLVSLGWACACRPHRHCLCSHSRLHWRPVCPVNPPSIVLSP